MVLQETPFAKRLDAWKLAAVLPSLFTYDFFFLKITITVMERSEINLFHFTIRSTDFWNQENSECENNSFHLSCCLVLKLNDLQSVNVGLFDQYFRITGMYYAVSSSFSISCLDGLLPLRWKCYFHFIF